ncbi:MAG: hypothetical protein ABS917_11230 [Solibacillus sp.]|uniref:hypothetical protein n=1 Tax=Solibacillus sp. TaxID=1909654 RepID=UPI003315342C
MKEMVKIIRKIDVAKKYESELVAEQDYWLASLSHAMGQNNAEDKQEALAKLHSITRELEIHRHRYNLK